MKRRFLVAAVVIASSPTICQAGEWFPTLRPGYVPRVNEARLYSPNSMSTGMGYYGGGSYNDYYSFRTSPYLSGDFYLPPLGTPFPYMPYSPRPFAAPPDPTIPSNSPEHIYLHLPPGVDYRVHITVRVPADAELWLDDMKSEQKGDRREFYSPPLLPGKTYVYEIKARWLEDGKPVEQTQEVTVRPGGRVRVDFPTLPEPVEANRDEQ